MGRSRTRTPTASCTAAATAASTPVAPSSPMPRAPIRLAVSSYSSVNETSMSAGMSAFTGTATLDRFLASHRPRVGSWSLSSMVALPQPQMMPPVICARAVTGLTIRPAE